METFYEHGTHLFGDKFQFKIPVYQRVYAWGRTETEALLRDLEANLDASVEDPEKLEPYNLGMLTLKRCSSSSLNDNRHDVVDGQQRLTTLSLIFAATKQYLKLPADKDEYTELLWQKGSSLQGTIEGPRLLLWPQAAAVYDKILKASEPIDWDEPQNKRLLNSEVAHLLKDNVECVLDFLASLNNDRLVIQLVQYILMRCEVAISVTCDQNLALQVFRAQTGKGKDLQPSDIMKAEIIAALGDEEAAAKFGAQWLEMEGGPLGRDGLQLFLVDLSQLFRSGARPVSITGGTFSALSAFVERLKKTEGGLVDFGKNYLPAAYTAYLQARGKARYHAHPEAGQVENDVNNVLSALNIVSDKYSREFMPLTMRVLMLLETNPDALLQVLRDLERQVAFLVICESKAKLREERYHAVLGKLETAAAGGASDSSIVDCVLPSLDLVPADMAAMRSACESPSLAQNKKAVLLVLLRLDIAMRASGTAAPDDLTPTIEHVLPQNPEMDSRWCKDFSAV